MASNEKASPTARTFFKPKVSEHAALVDVLRKHGTEPTIMNSKGTITWDPDWRKKLKNDPIGIEASVADYDGNAFDSVNVDPSASSFAVPPNHYHKTAILQGITAGDIQLTNDWNTQFMASAAQAAASSAVKVFEQIGSDDMASSALEQEDFHRTLLRNQIQEVLAAPENDPADAFTEDPDDLATQRAREEAQELYDIAHADAQAARDRMVDMTVEERDQAIVLMRQQAEQMGALAASSTDPSVQHKPGSTMDRFHAFMMRQAQALVQDEDEDRFIPPDSVDPREDYRARTEGHQVFVLAHDWTEILKDVIDTVQDDEVRLPYPVCVFDFAFDRIKTLVIARQIEGGPVSCEIAYFNENGPSRDYELRPRYSCGCGYLFQSTEVHGLKCTRCRRGMSNQFLRPQENYSAGEAYYLKHIKAACIALDTELAHTPSAIEVHQIQDLAREIKLRARLDKTHVLVLRARKGGNRYNENTGRAQRLHFRRGHWRHYQNGVIKWIRWCIAGRDLLGLVIKTYRM